MKNDSIPFHWRALIALIKRLPQLLISRVFGWLADRKLPKPLRKPVLGLFAKAVGINLSEAEKELIEYTSLNAFFVRKLKPGLRPLPTQEEVVISPVDGTLAEFGPIENGHLIQAKGIRYTLQGLLNSPEEASRFQGGTFVTIYLSPKDYHRIHAPCSGVLSWASYIPGKLFPVNKPAVALIPDLFARNERLICSIQAQHRTAVVAVGAMNVGRISSAFDPKWNGAHGAVSNHRKAKQEIRHYQPAIPISRAEEIMAFHLGSTIVLIFEPGAIELMDHLEAGKSVQLGDPIGNLTS